MTFFVDANVVVYAASEGPYRDPCRRVLEAVARGEADGRTSPVVLEEVWSLERSGRIGAVEGLTAHARTPSSPRSCPSPMRPSGSRSSSPPPAWVPPSASTSGRASPTGSPRS